MALRKPATVAVFLLGLLLISDLNFGSAATGGRVGGSLFSSSDKSSDSSSSSSKTSSSSSSTSSWQDSYHHHHHRHHHYPSTTTSSYRSSASYDDQGKTTSSGFLFLFLAIVAFVIAVIVGDCVAEKTSIVKLQVGLIGKARSLQADLNRITLSADTSTAEGLSYVLTGTTTAVLRNLDHCISSYLSVAQKHQVGAEECFKKLSMEERAKFDLETLVNVNNFNVHLANQSRNEVHKEYIVVTILVATRAIQKLPSIKGTSDLTRALQKLGSISSDKLLAIEVLWTPQQENDTLSERELLKDYPQLRGFYEEGPCKEGPFEDQQPFLGARVGAS